MDQLTILWKFIFIVTDLGLAGVIGWQVFLFNGNQKNKDVLSEYKLHVAEHYAKRDEIDAALNRLDKKLDKLFDELHNRKTSQNGL